MQSWALESKLKGTREPSTEGQSQCDPGLERSGGSRDCNGFLAFWTWRRLAARCRCTAAQLDLFKVIICAEYRYSWVRFA